VLLQASKSSVLLLTMVIAWLLGWWATTKLGASY
jgi:hypothetical protein